MDRRHPPQAVDRPAKIYLAGGEGLVCRIRDISKGGEDRITWLGWLPDTFEPQDSFAQVKREVWVVWREALLRRCVLYRRGKWAAAPKSKAFGRRQG